MKTKAKRGAGHSHKISGESGIIKNDMKTDRIEIGNIVRVDFNNAQFTLSSKAIVEYKPCATGDSWIFKDVDTDNIYYVSEGCTLTLLETDI